MKKQYHRPNVGDVKIIDKFWEPYIGGIRDVMLPYCFEKFEETRYLANYRSVAAADGAKHIGPPFTDGLLLETVRAACDFLRDRYDEKTDKLLDTIIDTILSAQGEDGFLSTYTVQDCPDKRWGENDGDIIHQHDLYNHGTLIEAGISHYLATGKTRLLSAAVKSAQYICSYIGKPPKHNIIPGHSLPEEAFIKLYRLFKSDRALDFLANEYSVRPEEYLELVRFWYDNRGNYENRTLSKNPALAPHYNQDTAPFALQRTAMGHAVRACLCYLGAATLTYELGIDDYKAALDAIWTDVTRRKLHISGGVGSRHDIEGFDKEYDLPNNAYLETCAGTALAFWAGEMSLIEPRGEYFDYFELSLYNNILGSVGEDFKSYYYDNALENDGTKNRWSWHVCPCCPPMLAKLYSSLSTYIYSYSDSELLVNMYIGSEYKNGDFSVSSDGRNINLSAGREMLVRLRVPEYAKDFRVTVNGKAVPVKAENGYTAVTVSKGGSEIKVEFTEKLRMIYASEKVEADRGKLCVMVGNILMCVEGADNGGRTDFVLAKDSPLELKAGGNVVAKSIDGDPIVFIPYFKRNNRVSSNPNDSKMSVWLNSEFTPPLTTTNELYGEIVANA